jgi:hypothetical protein
MILALVIVAIRPSGLTSQDPSPIAPPAFDCDAPRLPPGTPTSIEILLTQSTPNAEERPSTPGLPVLGDEIPAPAPPNDPDLPDGEPAGALMTERVDGSIRTVIACLQRSDQLGFAALVTERYRNSAFGTDNPYNAVMSLEGYPDIEILETGNAQVYVNGRVSTDVTVSYHVTKVYRFRAYFVHAGSRLLLDEERAIPFNNADVRVEVDVTRDSLTLSEDSLPTDSLINFNVINNGSMPAEIALIRLSGGVSANIVHTPSVADRFQNAGGVAVEPGESASFAVTELPPGTYALVSIVEDADGAPRLQPGMSPELIVE